METLILTIQKYNLKPKLALQLILPLILFFITTLLLSNNISFKTILPTINLITSKNNVTLLSNTTTNDHHHHQQQAPSNHRDELALKISTSSEDCDIFTGEWVPNKDAPYYTNYSCEFILEHQNCMKYGRPDMDFMKWRWKPDGCKLPIFNPYQFFELVRSKSLAFVGDSLARNQMESLICLLSKVEYPFDASDGGNEDNKRWQFKRYDFTVANFRSPFLVKNQQNDPNGPTGTGIFGLFLDEADESWTAQIDKFDYVVISAGHWFTRSMMYYEQGSLIGCRYCQIPNVTDYPMIYGYQKAFRTAFRTILERENFKGVVYLRTFSPSHFEGGEWNEGGDCKRKKPFKSSQVTLQGANMEMYLAQLEEFKVAQELGREREKRFRLMDLTQPMLMRPDGHPSKYGHWPKENVTLYNDCVHWCLPGPIDTWNDFLLEMIRNEGLKMKEDKMILRSLKKRLKSKQ